VCQRRCANDWRAEAAHTAAHAAATGVFEERSQARGVHLCQRRVADQRRQVVRQRCQQRLCHAEPRRVNKREHFVDAHRLGCAAFEEFQHVLQSQSCWLRRGYRRTRAGCLAGAGARGRAAAGLALLLAAAAARAACRPVRPRAAPLLPRTSPPLAAGAAAAATADARVARARFLPGGAPLAAAAGASAAGPAAVATAVPAAGGASPATAPASPRSASALAKRVPVKAISRCVMTRRLEPGTLRRTGASRPSSAARSSTCRRRHVFIGSRAGTQDSQSSCVWTGCWAICVRPVLSHACLHMPQGTQRIERLNRFCVCQHCTILQMLPIWNSRGS
jgi:hypothetical protein